MPRDVLLQVRAGTTAQWAAADPVLAIGEPGLDTDLSILKFGDGSHPWSGLDPISGGITAPDKITTRQIPYVPATIVNPGFEADLTGWAEYADELTSSYTISVDSTVYYSGTKSVKIVTGDKYMNVGVSQVMDLENVSALNFFASRESYLVSINVIFTTSSGTTTTVSAGTLSSDGWDNFSVDIPEGYDEKNVTVTIAFYGATTSGVIGYFDDVSLKYSSDDDFFYIADLDTYIGTAFEEYVDSPDKTTVKQVMYRQVTGETGEYAWITDLDTYIDDEVDTFLNLPTKTDKKQVPYRPTSINTAADPDMEDGPLVNPNHFFADATARDAYFTSNPGELITNVICWNTDAGYYQQYSGSSWSDITDETTITGGWLPYSLGAYDLVLAADTSEKHGGSQSLKATFGVLGSDWYGAGIQQHGIDFTDGQTVKVWMKGAGDAVGLSVKVDYPFTSEEDYNLTSAWAQYSFFIPEAARGTDKTLAIVIGDPYLNVDDCTVYFDDVEVITGSGEALEFIDDIDTYFDGQYCRFRGVSSSTPSDPIAGDIWIDTTSGSVPKIYDGTSWISLT